ncbi:MAG: hypothetical protein IJA92_03380 [Oscillospiraceae bacterium]|nr:hypothetical protein [Oscillospiraceae bacterium]
MKKFVLFFVILALAFAFSGCGAEELPEENTGKLKPVIEEKEPEAAEKITFKLGAEGEEKEYSVGDKIGEWEIAELYIDREENGDYFEISADFKGSLTFEGYIERNGIVEEGYDFIPNETSLEKMPYLVAGDFSEIRPSFFLHFPEEFENPPSLDFEESANVRITVSGFSLNRAPRMGMDGFDVVSIEYLDEKSEVPPKAEKAAFKIGYNGKEKMLSKGDKLDIWTLEKLNAYKDEEKGEGFYTSVSATFSGEIKLTGYIDLNPYNGAGYQFTIIDHDDCEKMPVLVSENLANFRQEFLIEGPATENIPKLEEGEYFPCYLTIKSYTINRGYTETFDSAEVIKIEIPEKDTGLPKLYEDILVKFGAWVNDYGKLMVEKGISLYYNTNGSVFTEEYAEGIYCWITSNTPREERIEISVPGYTEKLHALSAEYFEAEVYKYFGIPAEKLRESEIYYPDKECYFLEYGGGIGETPFLVINEIEENGDTVIFHLTLDYTYTDGNYDMALTVKLLTDGGYNYISYMPE